MAITGVSWPVNWISRRKRARCGAYFDCAHRILTLYADEDAGYERIPYRLNDLGLRLFAPEEHLAPVLTGIMSPDGVPSSQIVNYLLEEHHIKITGGFGDEMKERIFRVGHMGPLISEQDIDAVLAGVGMFLRNH